jgi:hypothetical protein
MADGAVAKTFGSRVFVEVIKRHGKETRKVTLGTRVPLLTGYMLITLENWYKVTPMYPLGKN